MKILKNPLIISCVVFFLLTLISLSIFWELRKHPFFEIYINMQTIKIYIENCSLLNFKQDM